MERRRQTKRPRHRGAPSLLWKTGLGVSIAQCLTVSALADAAAVKVAGKYDARVAHVETIGTLFNDKQDVGAGSGLLIGETLIVTNNHVVPDANNYKRLDIFIRL